MLKPRDDWEFAALGIYNSTKPGKLDHLIKFIRDNRENIDGDVFESGVYQGSSLCAIAMLLKELGSSKKVYGFDTFAGFPPVCHARDDLSEFDRLAKEERISKAHLDAVRKNIEWRKLLSSHCGSDVRSISTSVDFSSTSLELLRKKLDLLGLDNVVLVDGTFSVTMTPDRAAPEKIFAGIVDCDLYQSYLQTYEFVWPRLEVGGMLYLDEYYSLKFPGARRATDEFVRDKHARLEMAPPVRGDFERWHLIKQAHGSRPRPTRVERR